MAEYFYMILPQRSFYLLRHAETMANTQELACGLLDSPLTPRGYEQAKEAAVIISKFRKQPTSIYHSALSRSFETAKVIADFNNLSMIECSDLNEHNFGEWEGFPWCHVLSLLNSNHIPPKGESRKTYIQRVRKAFFKILSEANLNNPPLIVGHGGTFFALGQLYQFNVIDVANCQLFYFDSQNPPKNYVPWRTLLCSDDKEFTVFY